MTSRLLGGLISLVSVGLGANLQARSQGGGGVRGV